MALSKNKIQEIRKLHQKKFREELKLFLVEGTKSVSDLLASGLHVREILATESWVTRHSALCGKADITILSRAEMDRISMLTAPQEVIAVVATPHFEVTDINPAQPLLVLDDIRDPGNLGTILRTADWFGVLQVLCSASTVEVTSPKVIQATMGSFTRVKVIYSDLSQYLDSIAGNRRILGTFMSGSHIGDIRFCAGDILIIGNETNGISPEIAMRVTDRVHIPATCHTVSHAESLNASVAAGIAMFCWMG
ncbi:MAG: RNA methyltransferase [Bacteroidales bacterium]|jgi:TrmH family RNA methyltransferase|nr:RNA methyltransferase [Bacteroidales bacterium]